LKNAANDIRWAILFLTPTLAGLALISIGPILAVFGLSMADWDLMAPPVWVGLDNFRRMFADPLFYRSLANTLLYAAMVVPASMALAMGAAILLNARLPGMGWFRGALFVPFICPTVAVAYLWQWLYNPDARYGLLNWALACLGLAGPEWLQDPHWAMFAVAVMSVWQSFPYLMVIYLAGLQSIPRELYEAAAIDHAGPWSRFRHVTLPMLSSTSFFVLVISIIASFQVFDQTYVLTQGGPENATLTIVLYLYRVAFQEIDIGYSAALSVVLFAIIFAVTLIQWKLQHRWVHYA
jgi:multiple sugar transport system permease protein